MPVFTGAEVGRHNGPKSTWMVIANEVYDVTKFLDSHPGGAQSLLDFAGKDATVAFETVGHSDDARKMMKKYKIGVIPNTEHSSHAKTCDDIIKPDPFRVEFLVYQLGSRVSPPKSEYSTPKSSTPRIEPCVQTVVVPRDRSRRPPPQSSRLKWALLALAGALVIGIVLKKYAT